MSDVSQVNLVFNQGRELDSRMLRPVVASVCRDAWKAVNVLGRTDLGTAQVRFFQRRNADSDCGFLMPRDVLYYQRMDYEPLNLPTTKSDNVVYSKPHDIARILGIDTVSICELEKYLQVSSVRPNCEHFFGEWSFLKDIPPLKTIPVSWNESWVVSEKCDCALHSAPGSEF